MGVLGLLKYIEQNKENFLEKVDIISKSKELNGLEILVDFHSFQIGIYVSFLEAAKNYFQTETFRLVAGEYALIDAWYRKFVTNLQQYGIKLTFFIDACRGSNPKAFQERLASFKSSHEYNLPQYDDIISRCVEGRFFSDTKPTNLELRPIHYTQQIVNALRSCGCEIIQCGTNEADHLILSEFRRRNAFAICSNDTDFCIFENCRFIPICGFDMEGTLKDQVGIVPESPERLIVGLIDTNQVNRILKLDNHQQLIEFSNLAGNDFTKTVNRTTKVWTIFGRRIDIIKDIPCEIKKSRAGSIFNNRRFQNLTANHPEIIEAYENGRKFYSVESVDDPADDCTLFHHIVDRVHDGQLSHSFVGMHLGCYWQRLMIEDFDEPSGDDLLEGLRSQFYALLLPRNSTECPFHAALPGTPSVTEYARSPHDRKEIEQKQVRPSIFNYPTLEEINSENVDQNKRYFVQIMTHLETDDFDGDYMTAFGDRRGSMCLCLRYLIKQNVLRLTRPEFERLVAAVFWASDQPRSEEELAFFYRLQIVPNVRCYTVWNWLQNIFHHAYIFVAPIFYLQDLMPQPKDVFYSSLYFAFFHVNVEASPNNEYHAMMTPTEVAHISTERLGFIQRNMGLIDRLSQGINFQ